MKKSATSPTKKAQIIVPIPSFRLITKPARTNILSVMTLVSPKKRYTYELFYVSD